MTNEGKSWREDGRGRYHAGKLKYWYWARARERWLRILTSKYWTQRDGLGMISGETGGGQELPDNPSVYLTLLLLPTHRKLRAKSSNKICFYSQSAEWGSVYLCLCPHLWSWGRVFWVCFRPSHFPAAVFILAPGPPCSRPQPPVSLDGMIDSS